MAFRAVVSRSSLGNHFRSLSKVPTLRASAFGPQFDLLFPRSFPVAWQSSRDGDFPPRSANPFPREDKGDRFGDRGDRYGDRGDKYGDRGDRGDRYGDRGDRGDRYADRGDRYGGRDRGDRDMDRGDRYKERGRFNRNFSPEINSQCNDEVSDFGQNASTPQHDPFHTRQADVEDYIKEKFEVPRGTQIETASGPESNSPEATAPRADIEFVDLPLAPRLVELLRSKGFVNPTPIQAKAIPHIVEGRDVVGVAHTGTGKTLAFALPIIQDIQIMQREMRNKMENKLLRLPIVSLIVAPTRELAMQISNAFEHFDIPISCAIGGLPTRPQLQSISRGGVVVGTPGRLLDFHRAGYLKLDNLKYLVLDEVDRMLDMGFLPSVEEVCRAVSKTTQTLFFTATLPAYIENIAKDFTKDPVSLDVTGALPVVQTVQQFIVFVRYASKPAALVELIRHIIQSVEG
jgi:hypothetical protein